MEQYQIKHVSFTYPSGKEKALHDVTFQVKRGEFLCLCGSSGCGKTTLLRLLKSALSPHGERMGEILFEGKPLEAVDRRCQTEKIGFVMQHPQRQIVTDKVWHELAFGLESLGISKEEIRLRVSEMASFFGMEAWFHQKVTELSGGQLQLLNLASVMVLKPDVLILDEPTGQLDPIAGKEFLATVKRIHQELGTTVILSEHNLEEVLPMADRVLVLDKGSLLADAPPMEVAKLLKEKGHPMYAAMPTPVRVYHGVEEGEHCPLTVRDGRLWLESYAQTHTLLDAPKTTEEMPQTPVTLEMKEVWFRYEKDLPDVLKGLFLKVHQGEIYALLGGNGSGKTTALSLLSGFFKPYRGTCYLQGKPVEKTEGLYCGKMGVLSQDPQTLFVKKTVYLDLLDMLSDFSLSQEEKEQKIQEMALLCRIGHLLSQHPYDLSGGEQQRAALAKILLKDPEILLLDEPTKGFDSHFKQSFKAILLALKARGITVLMVSHDVEFCAEVADRCGLIFDGSIIASAPPKSFFAGNRFYTTAAHRMARSVLPRAVLAEDIISACGKEVPPEESAPPEEKAELPVSLPEKENAAPGVSLARKCVGGGFLGLFVLLCVLQGYDLLPWKAWVTEAVAALMFVGALVSFFPAKKEAVLLPPTSRSDTPLWSKLLMFLTMVLTIFAGMYFLEDRRYYFISLMLILETLIPFFFRVEKRQYRTREVVVISVLCAMAVAGRCAFFMLPQFKPVLAVLIVAGACMGAETGFFIGAMTGFVSNFFFGQGPWTPWQMFAFGTIGFLSGALVQWGILKKNKVSLSVFGFVAAVVIFGGIMNPASVLMMTAIPTWQQLLAAYAAGLPFDIVHGISTVIFLWFASEPFLEKMERMKEKYGFMRK